MKKVRLNIKQKLMKNYAHFIQYGIDPVVAHFLYARGIKTIKEAKHFLYADVNDLYDPALIKNIDKVYEIISEAIFENKSIWCLTDFDCDGCTGTYCMVSVLNDLGANVNYRIPDRLTEGYGLSEKAIREIHEKGCELLITVDNGIKNVAEIKLAKDLGMQVIILDHHTPGEVLPEADVIIDLHIEGETYPFKHLAGCGVAFKVACYLYEQLGYGNEEAYKFLDIVAIGTIGDVVSLTDENRIIVREGLKLINDPNYNRAGIIELLKVFNIEKGKVSSEDVGFKLSPAINAPGRLYVNGADTSTMLLLEEDEFFAKELAFQLYEANEERKTITKISLKKAEEYIRDNNLENDKVMVVFVPDIPEGVVGLVSGKITEKYNRPSLVFGEGHEYYKASGRSPEYFDLYKALCTCDDVFVKYGGHAQAAGMSVEKDINKIIELRKRLNEYADTVLTDEDLVEVIDVDDVLNQNDIDFNLIGKLDMLEPYGQHNRKPIFLIREFTTIEKFAGKGKGKNHYLYMGEDKNHLKLYGEGMDAVGFDMVNRFELLGQPKQVDVVCTIGINAFRGERNIQLGLMNLDKSKAVKKGKTELINGICDVVASIKTLQVNSGL